jgi:hypothetical protein
VDYVVRRHAGGSVILRPLKDGYYLMISLSAEAPLAVAIHFSERTKAELNQDL